VRTLHVNLDEAMKEDSDQEADLVRISGKSRPEFPEPTFVHNAALRAVEANCDRCAPATLHTDLSGLFPLVGCEVEPERAENTCARFEDRRAFVASRIAFNESAWPETRHPRCRRFCTLPQFACDR